MTPMRLYCSDLTAGENTLNREESHHAAVALRAKKGMEVTLFDGLGAEASGTIIQAHRRSMKILAARVTHYPFEFPLKVTIAVAFPKAHLGSLH